MDKVVIKKLLTQFVGNLKEVLVKYPVEYAIFIYIYVWLLIEYPSFDNLPQEIYLAPAFLCIAFIVNKLCLQGIQRIAYFVVLVVYVLCQNFIPMHLLEGEPAFIISYFIILPIGVLFSGIKYCDRPFVRNVLSIILSFVIGGFFVQFVLLLLFAILFSFTLIFGLESIENDLSFYIYSAFGCFVVPLVLFALYEQIKSTTFKSIKMLDILMNYIFTPAIWIYLLIMYAYLVKIIFQWTLPDGYIASLTFGFMVVAIIARALYQFVCASTFDKFYKLFSWIIIPVLALFWVGVMTRVCEYGFTPQRVYMVLCGIFVTIHTLLFLTNIKIRYTIFCGAIIAGFAVVAYIPYFHATQISVRSQAAVSERIAKELGVLTPDNKIDIALLNKMKNDSINLRETLCSAIKYVYMNDSVMAVNGLGVLSLDLLDEDILGIRDFYQLYFHNNQFLKTDISNYKYFYTGVTTRITADTVAFLKSGKKTEIFMKISTKDLFDAYLKSVGETESLFKKNMTNNVEYDNNKSNIIDYDSISINLRSITFNKQLNNINEMNVDYILVK